MNRSNWYLWVGVFVMLAIVARYAYLAAHPDSCQTLIGTDAACQALRDASPETRAKVDAVMARLKH